MKIYDNKLLGRSPSNIEVPYQDKDSLDLYQKNLDKSSHNWIYRTEQISYNYNSFGHRCKDIAELNFDNYILVAGCSHTEGIGIKLENSYPFILSKMLNCDYYNLGLGATGLDVLLYNITIWFTQINKLPKALIIQWPDISRSIIGRDENNFQPVGIWNNDEDVQRFILDADAISFFDARKILTLGLIESLVKVPIINLSIANLKPVHPNPIIGKVVDYGRDLAHPGILSHLLFAKSIHQYMINTDCLNFI